MKKMLASVALGAAVLGSVLGSGLATASDHDDISPPPELGGPATSGANNLTDLYVFRKGEEATGETADDAGETLVFIMNSYGRIPAGQEAAFNTNARYTFHASRFMGDPYTQSPSATPSDDVQLRFEFGAPDANNQQKMTVYLTADGNTSVATNTVAPTLGGDILTTSNAGRANPVANDVIINGQTIKVFAGVRQDPFFFDVLKFLSLRLDVANGDNNITNFFGADNDATTANAGDATTPIDFTRNFNVLSIVVEVPRSLLQGGTTATTFDIWETMSIPQ